MSACKLSEVLITGKFFIKAATLVAYTESSETLKAIVIPREAWDAR